MLIQVRPAQVKTLNCFEVSFLYTYGLWGESQEKKNIDFWMLCSAFKIWFCPPLPQNIIDPLIYTVIHLFWATVSIYMMENPGTIIFITYCTKFVTLLLRIIVWCIFKRGNGKLIETLFYYLHMVSFSSFANVFAKSRPIFL